MFPALFDEKKVHLLELDLGPYGTAGQLQQRPAPEGGGLFKREWFKYADAVPAIVRRVRGWDTAGTEGGGDYTAGVQASVKGSRGARARRTRKCASCKHGAVLRGARRAQAGRRSGRRMR
jgi:hypothetical protein